MYNNTLVYKINFIKYNNRNKKKRSGFRTFVKKIYLNYSSSYKRN